MRSGDGGELHARSRRALSFKDGLQDETRSPIGERVLFCGSLTAAISLGMLLGLGRRHSTLWRPLNAAAHGIIGTRADDVWGFQLNVTVVGVAVVLVVSAVAGSVAAALASSRRPSSSMMAAIGIALAGYLIHLHLIARIPGGLVALLTTGELRALYATSAVALFVGMRYAFSAVARHR